LIDPQASDEAQSLMAFLVDSYGEVVLAGQQHIDEIAYVRSATGKEPAVGAFDLMDYSPSRIEHGANPTGEVERYIDWANKGGGIVSLSWHWNAPTNLINEAPDKLWWSGFYTRATTFDVKSALADTSSEKYRLLIRDLDAISAQLRKFQDAELPVLWRPLHEASGGWFWWGAKGTDAFIELWRLMVDRYVNYHGLHNLIWVYTAGDPAWYPGDRYVDIVSLDIYTDSSSSMSGQWDSQQDRHGGVKLVALSETGSPPDPDKLRGYGVWWSWFSVWSGDHIRKTDRDFLSRVYNHRNILTLDELPDWKTYSSTDALPRQSTDTKQ
jgi:mannan endo-1,4-beta-mannosidase